MNWWKRAEKIHKQKETRGENMLPIGKKILEKHILFLYLYMSI